MSAYFYVINLVMLDGSIVHVGSQSDYEQAVTWGAASLACMKTAVAYRIQKSYY